MAAKKKGKGKVKAPKGFTIVPGQESPDEANERIKRLVKMGAERIEGARGRSHQYADGSVDGEVMVKIPRGKSANDALFDLQAAFEKQLKGLWVTAGERFIIKEDDEVYRRNKGMNEVFTRWQRANRPNVAEVLKIMRDKVDRGMSRKYRRKADTVFIRIHYSPDGERPKRR